MKYLFPILLLCIGVAGFIHRLCCPVAIGVGIVLIFIIRADDRPRDWK